MFRKLDYKNGFSLIEVLISVFILGILSLGIFSMFQFALRVLAENKARAGAVTLANEKLEIIRNLAYEDVGTVGGLPPGVIPENENITRNNVNYTINTTIGYVDDPFDGLFDNPPPNDDAAPNDYKKVKIIVGWQGTFGSKEMTVITNVAPKGLETMTGGILKITVFNASGQPVPQADVHIVNNNVTPVIDTTRQTDNQGILFLPNSPESLESYQITVTKTGYSTDMTCAINPATLNCEDGNPNPTKPHASVIEGEVTEISFAIDLVSTLVIYTINQTVPDVWTVNTDEDGNDQDNPAMAVCPNGDYAFIWRDYRTGQGKIYSQKYNTNQQNLWAEDKTIATASNQNNPDIAVDENCNIYAVWQDDRNGNLDIYFDSFDANGESLWGGSKKIDTQADNKDQTKPQIVLNATSSSAYIIWQDNRNDDGDIYALRFGDLDNSGGPTALWSPEVKINTDTNGNTQENPVLTIDDSNSTYIAWQDNRNGDYDIYAQKLGSDGGNIWGSDIKINTGTGAANQKNPTIGKDSLDYIYLAWQDGRNGDYDIYIQKYDTNGTKIWTEDIRVNSDTGDAFQENPVLAIDTLNQIYIVWQDYRNGDNDIYMQILDSAGNKLLDYDLRIDSGDGEQENSDIVISPAGYPVITWQDDSGGDWDIKAAQFTENPLIITPVPNVPLTITGAKTIGNDPVIYKYDKNYSTGSGGGLQLENMEWDSYTVTVSGGYTLLQSEPPQPCYLAPDSTLTVTLNVE